MKVRHLIYDRRENSWRVNEHSVSNVNQQEQAGWYISFKSIDKIMSRHRPPSRRKKDFFFKTILVHSDSSLLLCRWMTSLIAMCTFVYALVSSRIETFKIASLLNFSSTLHVPSFPYPANTFCNCSITKSND